MIGYGKVCGRERKGPRKRERLERKEVNLNELRDKDIKGDRMWEREVQEVRRRGEDRIMEKKKKQDYLLHLF